MPLVLVRIDDRLIHGQVVLGWCRTLKPDRIVVANDRLAANERERRMYAASVPPHIKASFLTLEETALELLNNLFKNEAVLILVESVRDVCEMIQKGVRIERINVGGLNYRPAAEPLLPYVFLTEEDRRLLRELVKSGVTLFAQDLPSNPPTVINAMVV